MKRGNIIKVIAAVFVLALIPATDASARTVSMGSRSVSSWPNVLEASGTGSIWTAGNNLYINISYVDQRRNSFPVYAKAVFYKKRPGGLGGWAQLGAVRVAPRVSTVGKRNSVTFSQPKSGTGTYVGNFAVCVAAPEEECSNVYAFLSYLYR